MFIYSLTEFDSRVTVDIDFLLRKIPNTPEQLRDVVEEIVAVSTVNNQEYADTINQMVYPLFGTYTGNICYYSGKE